MKPQDPFQLLLDAVIADDAVKVKSLLKLDPALARRTVVNPWLDRQLPHWIYKGDTALHLAAAGYRVAIAKMLLAAGADPCADTNHRRSQPLHYASDGCPGNDSWNAGAQVKMIGLLLDERADIHAQ